MLSVIVLNYNRLYNTKRTVQNLIDKTKVKHEFIFVDNGSVDGTREYLKSMENKTNAEKVTYVFNKRNFGVAGGRNSGMRIASGDYIMTIDDDILVPDDYDKDMIKVCDEVQDIGVVGVCVEKLKNTHLTTVDGIEVRKKHGNLGGACLCFPRSVFDKVGYFSTDFVYGIEDVDMYFRLSRLNLMCVYIANPGKHIDPRDNKSYEQVKRHVHSPNSAAFKSIERRAIKYGKGKKLYIPYKEPTFDTSEIDKIIKGKK